MATTIRITLTAFLSVVIQVTIAVRHYGVSAPRRRGAAGTAHGDNVVAQRKKDQRGAKNREAEGVVALGLHGQALG